MDLNDIWQENKRFITTVGAGLLVFLIGWMVVDGMYAGDIQSVLRQNLRDRAKLRTEMFTASDRSQARDENEALGERFDTILEVATFRPRPEFRLDQANVKAQDVYANALESVRDRLRNLASRHRAFLPDGLDIDILKTRNIDALERNLHAIDLLDRAVEMALEAGVKQIRSVDINLDPAFRSRRGLGAIEKTQVTIDTVSSAEAIATWILMCETPRPGEPETSVHLQALPIESIDARRAASKSDEVRTRVTFLVVRVNEIENPDADDA